MDETKNLSINLLDLGKLSTKQIIDLNNIGSDIIDPFNKLSKKIFDNLS